MPALNDNMIGGAATRAKIDRESHFAGVRLVIFGRAGRSMPVVMPQEAGGVQLPDPR
jgi:hypothetical protein